MLPLQKAVTDSIPSVKEELQMMKTMPFDDFINQAVSSMVKFAINLAIAIIVFYAGKFIIKKIHGLILGIMMRRHVDPSLSTFLLSMVRIVLYFLLIVIVIGILGIETSSFIALFASAGVAIGMALSGTLQNFAGGVLILLLKPYKVGDYIEAQGYAGTVTEIQIFSTVINTPDNKSIIVPNGPLSTGSINNWSREDYRRVDWTVSISYGDDFEKAKAGILAILADDPDVVTQYIEDDRSRRLQDQAAAHTGDDTVATAAPLRRRGWLYRLFHSRRKQRLAAIRDAHLRRASRRELPDLPRIDRSPSVVLDTMGASSVDIKVRAWVPTPLYWPTYYRINESIYKLLPGYGISFPFPQLDVHITQPDTQA